MLFVLEDGCVGVGEGGWSPMLVGSTPSVPGRDGDDCGETAKMIPALTGTAAGRLMRGSLLTKAPVSGTGTDFVLDVGALVGREMLWLERWWEKESEWVPAGQSL